VVEAVDGVVDGVRRSAPERSSRAADLDLVEQRLEGLVADLLGLLARFTRSTCSLRLALSSSMVSNSLASWANSSSGSGSSRS